MKDQHRKKLTERLEQQPGCFDPITAFRIAEKAGNNAEITSHIGVSLVVHPVSGVDQAADGSMTMRTTLAALSGPLGSLPPVYNETAMKQARNHAHAFSAFLNIFNARLAALFTDACEKYRLARLLRWHDRKVNIFVKTLLSLTGFGSDHLVSQAGIHKNILLHYSGFWSTRTRNAANLRALLRDFSGLPIEIEQFSPCWLAIRPEEQSRLGQVNARLGIDSKAGSKILDFSCKFRVIIGPVSYADYLSLEARGQRLRELLAIIKLYAGNGLDVDFQIVLQKADIPFSSINTVDPPRLGWNSWARLAPPMVDSADSIITSSMITRKT